MTSYSTTRNFTLYYMRYLIPGVNNFQEYYIFPFREQGETRQNPYQLRTLRSRVYVDTENIYNYNQ